MRERCEKRTDGLTNPLDRGAAQERRQVEIVWRRAGRNELQVGFQGCKSATQSRNPVACWIPSLDYAAAGRRS